MQSYNWPSKGCAFHAITTLEFYRGDVYPDITAQNRVILLTDTMYFGGDPYAMS